MAEEGNENGSSCWHLYVVRTEDGSLYTGIATDVERRFEEHCAGGRKAARFFMARKPVEVVFSRQIGTRSLATKVEYHFKRLPKPRKEAILASRTFHFDTDTGRISDS